MSNMNVSILLSAGLCNQIFMIFACISYAIDNNLKFNLFSKKEKTTNGTTTYWENLFNNLKENVIEDFENIDKTRIYKEPCFEYKQIPMTKNEIILSGYFQSYKYFKNNYEKIIDILGIRNKQQDIYQEHVSLFQNKKTIAMHFRFGDYLNLQNFHCIKTPDYYVLAVLEIEKQLLYRNENINQYQILYFVEPGFQRFVDDFLRIICNNTALKISSFVKVSDDIEDWKQLLIMSCCDHFIIANSTFSWFGAYFCDKYAKIVCRPGIWFGPANASKNINDLCPENWITIMK